MFTIDRYYARAALERHLLRSTPRATRAMIGGIPYIRVQRDGHPKLVPIIEIPDDEIAAMLPGRAGRCRDDGSISMSPSAVAPALAQGGSEA